MDTVLSKEMIDCTVQTIVKDGADYIRASLESVLPFVKQVHVIIDSRSTDDTREILSKLKERWATLDVTEYKVNDPRKDLVTIRNKMLFKITTKYGWVVDSDEVYPESVVNNIESRLRHDCGVLAWGLSSWALWDKDQIHQVTSSRETMRIFRYSPYLKWVGDFGEERLMLGDINLCYEFLEMGEKYVHFTHVKSDRWRESMGMIRRIDVNNMALDPMPESIKSLIDKIYVEKKSV